MTYTGCDTFMQEVNNLEKEKKEAKDDKKQEISRKIELKKVEKDLARIKRVKLLCPNS